MEKASEQSDYQNEYPSSNFQNIKFGETIIKPTMFTRILKMCKFESYLFEKNKNKLNLKNRKIFGNKFESAPF